MENIRALEKEPEFVCKLMGPEHIRECVDLVLSAFLEEPIFITLEAKRENLLAYYPRLLEEWLHEGVSTVVWDNANNRVAACGFNEIEYPGKKGGLKGALKWCADEKVVECYQFFDQLYGDFNPCEKYGVDKYFALQVGATFPEYRGRGVHTMNAHGRMDVARKNGISLVVVVPTSKYSQRVYEKMDYITEREMPYEDFKIDGKVGPGVARLGVHKTSKLMVKKL